jgi:thiamine pyrophosphokinase
VRAVIIANGEINPPVQFITGNVLIAADGGARHCLTLGLQPDIVIGDLDSLSEEHLFTLKAAGAQIVRFPTRKDFTDLELAVQHAQGLGVDEIVIYGALGRRWDQTFANLLLAGASTRCRIKLLAGEQEISFLRGGMTLPLEGDPGDTVSLIPLSGAAEGITTRNLEYPLADEDLPLGSTRGVSNILLGEKAEVSLREGLLVCVVIHQASPNILEEIHET